MRPPFLSNPPIKTYQSNAYALGAFLALGDGAYGILDNNFITLASVSNIKSAFRPITFLPFIGPDTFSVFGLGSLLSFKAFNRMELSRAIAASLHRGFLVRLGVDEYYIPDRWAYRNKHKIHDVLVTAVAHNESSLELIGYCADRRYRPSSCSLDELSEGYFAAVEKTGRRGFLAFKAELPQPVVIDIAAIKCQLEHFLQSRRPVSTVSPSTQRTAEPNIYGLAVFDACKSYLSNLTPTEWLDRRVFSLPAEHSEMMLRRTLRLESLFSVKIDRTAAEGAIQISSRLKLLSLMPEERRSTVVLVEMTKLFVRLKEVSQNAAETLLRAIEKGAS